MAGLVVDGSGTLYGTTEYGGTAANGTVFALTPPIVAGGAWTESVLHSFVGSDGKIPLAGLIFGPKGTLYGTTVNGGKLFASACFGGGCGVVYKLTPPTVTGGAWTESVVHEFLNYPSHDGSAPMSGLTAVANGTLYGTTQGGGWSQNGTMYKLTPPATTGSPWTESILHVFTSGPSDGYFPAAGVVFKNHELYGTTPYGGTVTDFGLGTVYEVTP